MFATTRYALQASNLFDSLCPNLHDLFSVPDKVLFSKPVHLINDHEAIESAVLNVDDLLLEGVAHQLHDCIFIELNPLVVEVELLHQVELLSGDVNLRIILHYALLPMTSVKHLHELFVV